VQEHSRTGDRSRLGDSQLSAPGIALSQRGASLAQQIKTQSHRTLWAISDLHVTAPANRRLATRLIRPRHPGDWLIVAGDIAEDIDVVVEMLALFKTRFAEVIFSPGNHEIYSRSDAEFTGKAKYKELIRQCRAIGVITPEDEYPVFAGHTIVPMFTLYDYSWRTPGTTPERAIAEAERRGIVLTDHYAIAPFVDIPMWCRERLAYTVKRLSTVTGPTILINHWPLAREPMRHVHFPDIGLWSGTRHTQQWAERYQASAVIYGHLHLPLELDIDGVCHAEVSLGYPKENERNLPSRRRRGTWPYPVLITTTDNEQAGVERCIREANISGGRETCGAN